MTRVGAALSRALRRHLPEARQRGRTLRRFAHKLGLVYFGSVDQHGDEHDVIRGLTVSNTHRDDHYAVGHYDGYDLSLVDRFDVLLSPTGQATEHHWVIFRLDLGPQEDTPHLLLRPLGIAHHPEASILALRHLKPINGAFYGVHDQEFHRRFEVLATASRALDAEALLTPEVTRQLASRLWPHAAEVFENKLYIYIQEKRLTESLLESALSTALWLARTLSKAEESED